MRKIAELKSQRPEEEIDVENNSDLWPEITDELELALDDRRVRELSYRHKSIFQLRVFDGERVIEYGKGFTPLSEYYVFGPSPQQFFKYCFNNLQWLRMGPHQFWFSNEYTPEVQTEINGIPKDYTFIDQADFRGRRCYVLENRLAQFGASTSASTTDDCMDWHSFPCPPTLTNCRP